MLFSSMTFVYIFLPLVCIAYFFVRPETRNCLLLLASIYFTVGENRTILR